MSLRPAVAALAGVLVAAAIPACGAGSVEDETVVLRDVSNAVVETGSSQRPASDGDRLTKNDIVRTREGGTATLVVRERRVVLAESTDVVVPDGARVELVHGALLVDRRKGPGVTVQAGDTTVDDVTNGALRVEKSYSLLVAGLTAGARLSTVTGARLDLAPLYQVVAPGRGLPNAALPLQLRHDDWEREVLADVLSDDERLTDLARGLDEPGRLVVPVAYRGAPHASDLVLADAIGRAAARDEPGRRSAANRARLLRGEGGSWGVVARLLDTTAVEVGTALADVLRGVPATEGDPGTTPATTPGGVVAGGTPRPGMTPSPGRTPSPTRSPDRTTKPPRPSSTSPTPSETPDELEKIISGIPTPPVQLPPILP